MNYLGDYVAGDVIDFKFNTRASSSGTAVPFALASGAVQVWKSNSTAATTAGITLTSTFASVTGLNHCRIESTSDSTFFANGGQFEAYLSAGTVNSVSVTGELVARFTMRAQASLYPTVSGRQLDVSAGGEAGVDWANVGSPTTVVGLSGTTIKTATDVETDTADIQSRIGTPSDLGGGASLSANLSDIEAQTDDIGAAGAGLTAIPWNASWDAEVQSEVEDGIVAKNLDKLVTLSGTADSGSTTTMVDAARTEADADYWKGQLLVFTSGTISGQAAIVTDFNAATDTFTFAPPTTQAVSTNTYVILPLHSVWDDTLAEHLASGTTGNALNAAGSAGDPWSTALPGAYGAGTAGKIIGDNINATVSSRATQTSVDTIDTNVDSILVDTTEIGAAGAGLTAIPWNAAWDAEVQSEVEDGLVAHRLDELLNADSDIDGAAPPTVGSVFHELMTKTAGSFTYDQTTDSIEAIRDRGDAAWITATGFSTHSATDVWAAASRTLTAATNITSDGSAITSSSGAVTVGTNNDKTGYSIGTGGIAAAAFAAGAIDAAAIAADAIGASEIAADAANEIADALLNRNVAGGSSTGRLVKQALYVLRNRVAIAAGTMTVYQTDDSTSEWTAAVTTAAGNPISEVDPA